MLFAFVRGVVELNTQPQGVATHSDRKNVWFGWILQNVICHLASGVVFKYRGWKRYVTSLFALRQQGFHLLKYGIRCEIKSHVLDKTLECIVITSTCGHLHESTFLLMTFDPFSQVLSGSCIRTILMYFPKIMQVVQRIKLTCQKPQADWVQSQNEITFYQQIKIPHCNP